jgi:purine-binding chemotaxis protein CheW
MTKVQKHASELMPTSDAALRILRARAEQLAQYEQGVGEQNGIAYVRFRLGPNEHYGVAYQYVQEVLHAVSIAKPPFAPDFITGVINWRGTLITIVDLMRFFHPSRSEAGDKKIIVINANEMTLGLLINSVEGSGLYQPMQLATPLASVNVAHSEYILGLDLALTAILNVEALILGLSQEIKKSIYRIGDVHGNN